MATAGCHEAVQDTGPRSGQGALPDFLGESAGGASRPARTGRNFSYNVSRDCGISHGRAAGATGMPLMIRPIVKFGHDVLHQPARVVEESTPDLDVLVRDMIETMYAAPGIGLAAPQVGIPLRLFVIDLSLGREANGLITLVNPEFVEREGMQLEEEGCLSLPGFNATVARPERVVIRGFDLGGHERILEGSGLLARAFQHEMDHLDGRVFVDRLRGIKREVIVRKIQKLNRSGKW